MARGMTTDRMWSFCADAMETAMLLMALAVTVGLVGIILTEGGTPAIGNTVSMAGLSIAIISLASVVVAVASAFVAAAIWLYRKRVH